jgi:hypothetical protein
MAMNAYGWNPVKLYKNYSIAQLLQLRQEVQDAHPNPAKGSIWLYTKLGHKRLDIISRVIQWHLNDKKAKS